MITEHKLQFDILIWIEKNGLASGKQNNKAIDVK